MNALNSNLLKGKNPVDQTAIVIEKGWGDEEGGIRQANHY